ncbi:hypothetical protein KIW84_034094 [Lathyrus oleraceus]|uniref:Putative plant transposon protein domain-containing protein n=1 Tax=Pisum sativum TaxID=3888 RepID=A0A9D4Y1W8_PEA|nr:hypothetical protein KIW84_034094 [Pisum sativum]
MDAQQQQVFNFSQQMESSSTAQTSSIPTPTVTGVSITPVYKEPHVLDREPHINLATPFEGLEVLCETLVDFDMKRNGVDLTEELRQQGWGNYFQRLYGPVYPLLIKEFWRFADADDHFIVSYVLGVKIVITEKSIASLLNMERDGGKRIYNINPRSKRITEEINPTIFKLNAEGNPSKNKELHQNLRVWLKIILGTIHHRPASNSSNYINADQKCILYCIHKGVKICLPALLFRYLRDSVRETRNNMKLRSYIPLGRLLSDVFIENGLVDHLEKAKLMQDLVIDTGRPLNARNLKSMGIIKKIQVRPTLDTSWDSLKDQRKLPHGLARFYKNEPRDAVAIYLQRLLDEGVDISDFRLDGCLDSEEDFVRYKRGLSEKKIASQAKKARLGESSGSRSPAPLQISTGTSVPPIPSEPLMVSSTPSSNPLPTPPIYTTSDIPPSTTKSSLPKSDLSPPESPPYLIVSSDPEHSDPSSPTLAQLQALNQQTQPEQEVTSPPPEPEVTSPPQQPTNQPSEAQPSENQPSDLPTSDNTPPNTSAAPESETEPEPLTLNLSPPTSPPHTSEPDLSIPTLEEAIMLFAGASVQKVKSLTTSSGISDDPDSVRTHWNRVIGWMTSEAFKLKHISEQVRNDFIRDAEARLQERLAREAAEEARRLEEERLAREAEEARRLEEEKARQAEILREKEAEAKALADAAAAAEAEAQATAEAQQAMTQGESSSVVPMVLQTLEELKKDQKELRARIDKQDTVNDNIQNMLALLLQRMPPPPNP